MPSKKRVQYAHNVERIKALHGALLSIVAEMNRPQRDADMVRQAGISLDRALFPLLVRIERDGPIGVVELADSVGRNYTSVSRQVAKLEELGFVSRQASASDRRVREAVITAKGRGLTDEIDVARAGIGQAIFEAWSEHDADEFVRLLIRFASDLRNTPGE